MLGDEAGALRGRVAVIVRRPSCRHEATDGSVDSQQVLESHDHRLQVVLLDAQSLVLLQRSSVVLPTSNRTLSAFSAVLELP